MNKPNQRIYKIFKFLNTFGEKKIFSDGVWYKVHERNLRLHEGLNGFKIARSYIREPIFFIDCTRFLIRVEEAGYKNFFGLSFTLLEKKGGPSPIGVFTCFVPYEVEHVFTFPRYNAMKKIPFSRENLGKTSDELFQKVRAFLYFRFYSDPESKVSIVDQKDQKFLKNPIKKIIELKGRNKKKPEIEISNPGPNG